MEGIAPVTHGVMNRAVQVGGIRLTETSHVPNTRLGVHRHAFPAVTFVLRGGFAEDFGPGRLHECGAMSVLVKPAGAPHSNRYSSRGARSFILECTDDSAPFGELDDCAPHVAGARLVLPMLELYAAFLMSAPERLVLAEEIGFEAARAQSARRDWRIARRPRWLTTVAEAAADSCTRPTSLAMLAGQAAVHPVYLARAFRRHFGQSLGAFMLQCRVRRAMDRLASTSDAISGIAMDCGFADQAHLTRLFRREVGVPPAVFRRIARRASAPDVA